MGRAAGWSRWIAKGIAALVAWPILSAGAQGLELSPCWLKNVVQEAQCGKLRRPLDPAQPQGQAIDIHVALLPAATRNKRPDPVFFFAGGPGQSAIDLVGAAQAMLGRLGQRRDIVLVDQRGTGRSAALTCEKADPKQPLAQAVDLDLAVQRRRACAQALQKLPHGDLRQYTTTIAMGDVEAIREALGAPVVNLVGGSYGTRAALEYMRLHPQRVRSAVLDGVAPPDMSLTRSVSADNQAAFDTVFTSCDADQACAARYPSLRRRWEDFFGSLPRPVTVPHPMTGEDERVILSRDAVLGAVRSALYVPSTAAALPAAIDAAARGRAAPLLALSANLGSSGLAEGMHFSVLCAEDAPQRSEVGANITGRDFGDHFDRFYRAVCSAWPKTEVSEDFRTIAEVGSPTLLLSGGADPATPPRHGDRVAKLLGAKAVHVVVQHAGHGLMSYACVRDAIARFVERAEPPAPSEVACTERIPRPVPYLPVKVAAK